MDGEITPAAVERLRGTAEAPRIVDIRAPAAFERGHIPGSENIPLPELTGRVESLDGASHIVTVCPHGQASVQAARLLSAYEGTADARIESMRGGLSDWEGDLVAAEPTEPHSDSPADEGPQAPF